jgi:hypothetical protein
MSVRSLTGRRGRLIGLAVVAVALAGLFAMHGLSPHGTTHASSETTSMHGEHETGPSVAQLPGDDDSEELLMLCLALLVAAVIGLAGRRHATRWFVRDAILPGRLVAPAASRRYRDPPDLLALSIQRC